MKTTFETDSVARYEFANGHMPHGTGAWMFDIVWDAGDGSYMNETVTCSGSFAQAKAEAMRVARRDAPGAAKYAYVRVCS